MKLAVLAPRMEKTKLEIEQSVLLPWIIKSGWHYTVEFTDQNTKPVFIAFQAES